ncbi:MAG: hypothetical protein ACETWR_13785 [Anaerolineae bacterium]
MQGHIRTATSLCLVLLALSLAGWPADAQVSIPSADGEHGWIQVAPNCHYFQFEDGTSFFPVGYAFQPQQLDSDPAVFDRYFQYLHEHGINLVRVTMDVPPILLESGFLVEDPVGVYNPDVAAALDALVAAAEQHDIYLLVCPYGTFYINIGWADYPYNSANGGPVEALHRMYSNPEAIELEKARFRWLIDNWGNSAHIFAWELMNEMEVYRDPDLTPAENIALHNAWINDMGAYVRDYELSRYGKAHLLTVSVGDPSFPESLGDGLPSSAIYDSPELDFVSYHTYGTDMPNTWEGVPLWSRINPVGYVLDLHGLAHAVRGAKVPDRPILDTEDGAFLRGPSPFPWWQDYGEADFDETFLATNWATFTGSAAGTGLRWPASPPYEVEFEGDILNLGISETQADSQLGFARFAAHVDWTTFAPEDADGDVQTDLADVVTMALSDGQTLVGWLLHDTRDDHDPHPIQPQVTFFRLSDEPHTVTWFDEATGDEIARQEVDGAPIVVTTPSFERHIAVLVQPTGQSSPGTEVFLPIMFK